MTPTSWLPPSVPPVASGTNRNSRKEQSARMSKVRFFDKRVVKIFLQITSIVSSGVSLAVIFFDIPTLQSLGCSGSCNTAGADLCGSLDLV